MESPRQRSSEGRRTTPHHAGTHDGHWANGVGNGECQGNAKLLHQYSETPNEGDHGGSLNRAARREVPVVAETALTQRTTRKKGRSSPRSKPDKQDSQEAELGRNQGRPPTEGWYAPGGSTVSPRQICLDWWPQGATTPPGKLSGGGSQGVPSQTREATTQ